jgi:hypothetical protein
MLLTVEPEQKRVAAEFQQRTAAGVCVREDGRKASVDRVSEMFSALFASSSQAL